MVFFQLKSNIFSGGMVGEWYEELIGVSDGSSVLVVCLSDGMCFADESENDAK